MGKSHCVLSTFQIGDLLWNGDASETNPIKSTEKTVKVLKKELVYEWATSDSNMSLDMLMFSLLSGGTMLSGLITLKRERIVIPYTSIEKIALKGGTFTLELNRPPKYEAGTQKFIQSKRQMGKCSWGSVEGSSEISKACRSNRFHVVTMSSKTSKIEKEFAPLLKSS